MTEITAKKKRFGLPPRKYRVSARAFALAFVLSPIVVAVLFVWTFIAPFGVVFGLPAYVLLGLPTALLLVGRFDRNFFALGFAGFVVNAAAGLVGAALGAAPEIPWQPDDAVFYFGYGAVFAPLMAGTFGAIYDGFFPKPQLLKI